MILSEQVREKIGSIETAIFDYTATATGAAGITAASLGFTFIEAATYHPQVAVISDNATTFTGLITTARGVNVAITGRDAETGTLQVYGW